MPFMKASNASRTQGGFRSSILFYVVLLPSPPVVVFTEEPR